MKKQSKQIGDSTLWLFPGNGKWALSTDNWCSGTHYTYAEALEWFNSIATIKQIENIVNTAYSSAYERSYC